MHQRQVEPWKVTLVDTGDDANTGGRLKAVKIYLKDEEPFCFTYGDGVADIDIGALLDFHTSARPPATVTAVQPPGRFGALEHRRRRACADSREKPAGDGGWINGGFFVAVPQVLDYIDGPDRPAGRPTPLVAASRADGKLMAYRHEGFWQPMDTLARQAHA